MSSARAFLGAFPFAWNGLAAAVATQRNMRVHVVAGVLACGFAALAPLAAAERALLVALAGLVLAAEATNTGIEALVDLLSPAFHERARVAKDAAAGAVLAAAAASLSVLATVAVARWPEIWGARAALAWPAAGIALTAGIDAAVLVRPGAHRAASLAGLAGLGAALPGGSGAGAAALAAALALHLLACAGAARMASRPG
jgi:diacylglycerol kinase (ATP)